MKKFLSIIVFLLAACCMYAGERGKFDLEAYKAEQHQFIQKQACLTADEAKSFFAVYDELRTKEREIFSRMRELKKSGIPNTEAEARKMITDFDKAEVELKKMQQAYHLKLLKLMPAKKIAAALIAASKFDHKKFSEWNRHKHKK